MNKSIDIRTTNLLAQNTDESCWLDEDSLGGNVVDVSHGTSDVVRAGILAAFKQFSHRVNYPFILLLCNSWKKALSGGDWLTVSMSFLSFKWSMALALSDLHSLRHSTEEKYDYSI